MEGVVAARTHLEGNYPDGTLPLAVKLNIAALEIDENCSRASTAADIFMPSK
jgi:hypothetical protein